MSRSTSRREFLKQSAAIGAVAWAGHSIQPTFAQSSSSSEKIAFASIGVEGKGASDSKDAGSHGTMVAICDIDEGRLAKAAARFPDAKKFVDYREMLEKMEGKIDAVTVSTPDHSHAPASVMAMKKGMHCFTQKPLTWSIHEARVMRTIAKEKGVATQMGNQGTSNNGLREAVEIVRAGILGELQEVHVWTNRPIWAQGKGRPTESKPVPAGLHWDLFLGPAAERPYHSDYHPFAWRGWVDFGTGALGDMACHTANMVVMAADLFDPVSVVADAGIFEGETYPSKSKIEFEFPSRKRADGEGEWGPTPMTWYDGGNLPAQRIVPGVKFSNSGSILVGSELTLYSPNDYGAEFALFKTGTTDAVYKTRGMKKVEIKGEAIKTPEKSLPRSPGHFKEYAIACQGGVPAMSNFDYAARLTGTILLGNVALKACPGKVVNWNAEKFTTGDKELDKHLHRNYRDGWTL